MRTPCSVREDITTPESEEERKMNPTMSAEAAAAAGTGVILCASRYGLAHRRHVLSLSWNPPAHFRTAPVLCRPPARLRNLKFVIVTHAVDSTQPSPATAALSNKALVSDDGFSITKVSFGVIGLAVGCTLLSYGFGAYFNVLPGSEWSAIMLTYGFPLAIIGMALKYAELKPVSCVTYADAQALRETYATPILKQVREDVTRFRYGDEQHLDEALKRIFQYGQGGGIPRRNAPVLEMIREEVTQDGKYSLVLVFQAKALQLSDFEQRQAKFASFFGPGITAEVGKGESGLYEVRLISNTVPQ